MRVLRSLLAYGVLLCAVVLSSSLAFAAASHAVSADKHPTLPAENSQHGSTPKNLGAELQRNPDDACLRCHKPEKRGMHGKHGNAINPNTHLPVTCTNCHGKPSPLHREKVKDVMRFNHPMYDAATQNSVCMSCHQPQALHNAFWPHDVHLSKVACASCHQLHPQQDRMEKLNDKTRIKICVDCHSQQQQDANFNPAAVRFGKEWP
ncbi:cytochrome c nitrite reductase pentaheme subunit [Serratia microhaemolytica]|uniref:cytochrome c nitrite reductase pentaheme subunit n=1 Tax=Serratia microhaemolytica TaxID=2675110 RepID=UPI000FDE334C|nr:cytochrome c nitrite reductase pentaheme subunit [Serratia microhaemolytica]